MTTSRHRAWAAVLLGLLACATVQSAAQARVWTLPSSCRHGASGDEFDDPPVVDYVVNGVAQPNAVQNVAWQDGVGFAQIWVTPHFSDIYAVTVAYTPFLAGSIAVNPQGQSKLITDKLPAAGVLGASILKVFDTYTVTINDSNSRPMAGATVLWTPFFNGADPYITTTDNQGQLTLACVQAISTGYSVYVISADGQTQFTATVTTNNLLTAARRGRSSRAGETASGSNKGIDQSY
jgi:hypothetical protein